MFNISISGMNSVSGPQYGDKEVTASKKNANVSETTNKVTKKLDDGYTVVKNSDGSYEMYDPDGKKLTQTQMLEYVRNKKSQKSGENQAETGKKITLKTDDGYTIVKYSDGKREIYDPNGEKLSESQMKEYENKINKPASETKTEESKSNNVQANVQNKSDNSVVKKYSAELDSLGSKYIGLIKDRGNYSPGELYKEKNKLVKDDNNQNMFKECLGDPNKPALAMNGIIRTQSGTTFYMARKQDVHTGEYYWDITRIIPKKTDES